MTDYISVPIESSPAELLDAVFTYIQDRISGWEPSEGNLEVILAEALVEVAAEIRDLASDVPTDLFRYFGTNLANLPPTAAAYATGVANFTMRDNAGYTVPQGMLFTLPGNDGNPRAFRVEVDTSVAPGSTVVAVDVIADEIGSDSSGLTGVGSPVDYFDFVSQIAMVGSTEGGADEEDTSTYLPRLVELLRLQSPRPILPSDFSILATTVPEVGRAVAIDNYNAGTDTYAQPAAVTVAVVKLDGSNVSYDAKQAVKALLTNDDGRVLNLDVYVIDPTRPVVKVSYDGTVLPGYDANTVKASVNAALTSYLDDATWGSYGVVAERPVWINMNKVRSTDIARVILNVDGVAFLNSAPQLALAAGSLGTADVTLPGPAPLATIGTITAAMS